MLYLQVQASGPDDFRAVFQGRDLASCTTVPQSGIDAKPLRARVFNEITMHAGPKPESIDDARLTFYFSTGRGPSPPSAASKRNRTSRSATSPLIQHQESFPLFLACRGANTPEPTSKAINEQLHDQRFYKAPANRERLFEHLEVMSQ
jgi:hypothetical protein